MAKRAARGNGMIRQRSDGRWEARYTLGRDPGTGKQMQKSIYGKTQEEVRKKLAEITKDIDDGIYADSGDITVARWMDLWCDEYTINVKDKTQTSYESNIRLHINPNIGAVKLSKLTPLMIQRFYKKLLTSGRIQRAYARKDGTVTRPKKISEGLSPKSVRIIHSILHEALKQATKPPHSLIKYNPADNVSLPPIPKKEMQILTDDEIPVMLNAMKDHWHYAIYHTALFCGLRRGEVLAIELDRYLKHRENKCIDIIWQLQRNKKDRQLRLVSLKNNKVRRVYPCDAVFDVIDDYLKLREAMENSAGENWIDSGLLFTNNVGAPLDGDAVYKAFKNILKKAGVKDIRMHDLRHTYATVTLSNGTDVKTLQEDLGHYDPGFTLKQYGHSTPRMKESARERMNDFVSALKDKTE